MRLLCIFEIDMEKIYKKLKYNVFLLGVVHSEWIEFWAGIQVFYFWPEPSFHVQRLFGPGVRNFKCQ